VGNDGETLVADSSTSTGLRWQGSAIGKNAVINGACEIAQRGTAAVTLSSAVFGYPVDRFIVDNSASGSTATAQQITSTTLDGFQYAVRMQRTSGSNTGELQIGQTFETANSIPFANKTIVFSFYARAGANYSPTSSLLGVRFYTGTGTDQSGYGYNFTGAATPISSSATLTTSWQRFQFTATLSSTMKQMQFLLFSQPTGTAGANDYYDVTGFQVELGSVATPFSRSQGTIQGELAACRYYYRRNVATGSVYGIVLGDALSNSTTSGYANWNEAPMRAIPTSVDFANIALADGNSAYAISAVTIAGISTLNVPSLQLTSSGLTASRPFYVSGNNNAAGYLGISAEL
jgi:hypothetical protein